MKRAITLALCAALALALLSACGGPGAADTAGVSDPPASDGALADSTQEPSLALPSPTPSAEPSLEPSEEPSGEPSAEPSEEPSAAPVEPSAEPSPAPAEPKAPDAEPSLSLPPDMEATPPAEPSVQPEEPSAAPEEPGTPGDGEVDLQAFYDQLVFDDPDFNASMELYNEYLDVQYPGLTAIPTKQLIVYQPMISAVVCEIALVEVEDSDDIKAVLDLLQARITAQVGTDDEPGGAWYPASIEGWQNNSRIVSHGRYIMMIAYDKCDDVVAAFDALF